MHGTAKRSPIFRLLFVCVLFACVLYACAALSGCKAKAPKNAADTAMDFLTLLKTGDYDSAYNLLSTNAQEATAREEFVNKYSAIFGELGLTNIDVLSIFAGDTPLYSTVQYSASYTTTYCGQLDNSYQMNLVHQSNGWRIEWAPSLIFPDMEKDDTVRVLRLPAHRGEIFSGDGELLAANVPGETVTANPDDIDDPEAFAQQIAPLLDMTVQQVSVQLQRAGRRLAVLKSYVPGALDSAKKQAILAIRGAGIENESLSTFRQYPKGEAFFHVTGYTGKITAEELAKFKGTEDEKLYGGDSIVGKSGLEYTFDKTLRGRDGREVYIADKLGNKKRTLYTFAPVDGTDLLLSINSKMQKRAYDLLKLYLREGQSGVAIVMNPQTGKIDALVSYPGFDANRFVTGISEADWAYINKNENGKPLFNRALWGLYPPGSLFKPLTADIALENGAITNHTRFPYQIVDDRWTPDRKDWFYPPIKRVENKANVCDFYNGIVQSDNIFFAWAAMEVGQASFTAFCERIGLGVDVPFDLPTAKSQLKKKQTEFNIKFLADSGYGQGEMLITPLQMAALYCALADDGNIPRPSILLSQNKEDGIRYSLVKEYPTEPWLNGVLDHNCLEQILPAMEGVVTEGTAKSLNPPYRVAAKTGTAEIGNDKTREIGWFAGFKMESPRDKLVLVMVDVGTNEGTIKIDIARDLFRYQDE